MSSRPAHVCISFYDCKSLAARHCSQPLLSAWGVKFSQEYSLTSQCFCSLGTALQMSEGVENMKEQLSVGFLNVPKSDKQVELYLDTFDVVITNDGPFDLVIDLLKDIINNGKH